MMDHTPARARTAAGVLCAAAIALGVAGCGAERTPSSSTGSHEAAPAKARVTIEDFAFAPAVVRVREGGTVAFRNLDTTEHTATASDNKSFDSGTIKADGATRAVRFTQPGRFAYYCAFHAYMKGTVDVVR